ncbi:MAG: aldolase/citrate lyase family protein, partial [Pseudomonadota bacterium]|nr:aldolase/citrate lyase family protein [Pseudomonadota bacterium]
MTKTQELFSARSWLFAPGDSEKKMQKAADSAADIALFDLEDAVADAEKPKARSLVQNFLKSQLGDHARLWVRINPLQGEHALLDLVAVMPGRPGGIMVPKTRSGADLVVLDHYLSALEVANGIAPGSTKVFPLVTETAEGMLATGTYAGAPRLVAMTWGAEDLADSLGASENRNADGSYGFTYQLARS